MKDNDYKKIETQALGIVDTLTALKKQMEGYSKARIASEENLASLGALADEVSDAAHALRATSEALGETDYASLLGAIDTHAAEFSRELEQRLGDQQPSDALIARFEQLDASMRAIDERTERLESFEGAMLALDARLEHLEQLEAGVAGANQKLQGFEELETSIAGVGERLQTFNTLETDLQEANAKLQRIEDELQGGQGGSSEDFALLSGRIAQLTQIVLQSQDDVLQFAQNSQQHAQYLNTVVDDLKTQAASGDRTMRNLTRAVKTRDADLGNALAGIAQSCVDIAESVRQNSLLLGNLQSQIYEMKDILSRVDRNTQKGFGKERG